MADQDDEQGTVGDGASRDATLAREIAQFVADRAFLFDDHECRAWALTDFEVWASLAGSEPRLRFEEGEPG